jgi:toxin ParE1/3/4
VFSEEALIGIDDIFEFREYKFDNPQAIKDLFGLQQHLVKLIAKPDIRRERNEIKKGLFSLPYI